MSADDQRAAEAEYERLRTAVMGQAKEIDRLRTELAETRTVGDALAAGVTTWLAQGPDGPMGKTMLCPLVDMWTEVRGDAPAPAVELPVTLSSPDDVAAVCLAHGLTVRSSGPGWTQWRDPDTKVVVHCEAWQSGVERVTVAGRDRADIYRPVARGTLVAAIEAAWGGSR